MTDHRVGRGRWLAATAGVLLLLLAAGAVSLAGPAKVPTAASSVAAFPAINPAPSLDPGFPEFPLPAGARLIHAGALGAGSSAIRQASWSVAPSVDAVNDFYLGVDPAAWRLVPSGDAVAERRFAVELAAGRPVTGGLRLSRRTGTTEIALTLGGAIPAGSAPPGFGVPIVPRGTKPGASSLPDEFPVALVPPDSTVLDSGPAGAPIAALFLSTISSDELEAYYLAALATSVAPPTVERSPGGFVIHAHAASGELRIVVLAVDGGNEVGVAELP